MKFKIFNQRDYEISPGDVITNDKYLSYIYNHVYRIISSKIIKNSITIEIGGVSYSLRYVDPDVLVSNIELHENIDLVMRGEHLPFKDSSLGNLVLKDTFHHLENIESFFEEAIRVLKPNGVVVLIEPYWGRVLRAVDYFFHPEPFDFKTKSWNNFNGNNHMGNQALAYNVFVRDKDIFRRKYPNLSILNIEVLVGLSYILSGGVYKRTFLPGWFLINLHKIENRLKVIKFFFGTQVIIVIKKNGDHLFFK